MRNRYAHYDFFGITKEELKKIIDNDEQIKFIYDFFIKLHKRIEDINDKNDIEYKAYKELGYLATGYDYEKIMKTKTLMDKIKNKKY